MEFFYFNIPNGISFYKIQLLYTGYLNNYVYNIFFWLYKIIVLKQMISEQEKIS